MRRSLATAAGALAFALSPAPALAAKLPVGRAHGVRVEQGRSGPTITFTRSAQALWRQIAGQRVDYSCVTIERGVGLVTDGSSGYAFRAPRRRRPLRPGMLAPRTGDWCVVSLYIEHRNGDLTIEPVVAIPLTQAGAVVLDEREKTEMLEAVLSIASIISAGGGPSGFPTAGTIDRWLDEAARMDREPQRLRVVALADAEATPPAGRVGWWTDGGQRAAAVVLSASGRRLFIEVGPDDLLRTNVARALIGGDDAL